MLLVHDQEAKTGEWSEHRRTRADNQIHRSLPDPVPLIVTFTVGETAMLDRHTIAEHRADLPDHLWRQCDLGDQYQHAPPRLDRVRRQPQIQLGLSAAGDSMQQCGVELTLVEQNVEIDERRVLLRSQRRGRGLRREGSCPRQTDRVRDAPL